MKLPAALLIVLQQALSAASSEQCDVCQMYSHYAELMPAASAATASACDSTSRPRFAGVIRCAGMSWIGAPLELRSTMSLASFTCIQIRHARRLKLKAEGAHCGHGRCVTAPAKCDKTHGNADTLPTWRPSMRIDTVPCPVAPRAVRPARRTYSEGSLHVL